MRRPEADLLTKEQTLALMQEAKELKIGHSIIARHFNLSYQAPYSWAKGTARAPKELETYVNSRKAEVNLA